MSKYRILESTEGEFKIQYKSVIPFLWRNINHQDFPGLPILYVSWSSAYTEVLQLGKENLKSKTWKVVENASN